MTTRTELAANFVAAAGTANMEIAGLSEWADRIATLMHTLIASHKQGVLDLAAALAAHDKELANKLTTAAAEVTATASGDDYVDMDNDLAFCLYWMHNPPQAIEDAINAHPLLSRLWTLMAKTAPQPAITAADIKAIESLNASGIVLATSDGTVLGTHKYEQLDTGWLWTIVNRILNWIEGPAKFRTNSFNPIALSPRNDTGTEGQVKIAIIGDWGTGTYPASPEGDGQQAADVLRTANSLNPDYIIHLGDTYYAGTNASRPPANEEKNNMVDLWQQLTPGFPADRFFTLNSNHEMYGGTYGLYEQALDLPMFAPQNGATYFALAYKNWLIGGIDSAYYSDSVTYLKGGMGTPAQDPQYDFLQSFAAHAKTNNMTTLLMSHHNPITTFADGLFGSLWDDVTGTGTLTPDYWYWGHIHLAAVYKNDAPIWNQLNLVGQVKARCVGHSAIPVATPWGFSETGNASAAEWWAATPKSASAAQQAQKPPLVEFAERIKNGFAMLTLSDGGILEEMYDQGSTTPTWSSAPK